MRVEERRSRESDVEGLTAATTQMIEHFDSALTQFEADVRAGRRLGRARLGEAQ